MLGRRSRRQTVDIWPGFVDALSALLMVIIFVLLVFVLAQFFLGKALTSKDESISSLSVQMAALTKQLSLERSKADAANADLARLSGILELRAKEYDALNARASQLETELLHSRAQIDVQDARAVAATEEVILLDQQLAALKLEMARLVEALDASEKLAAEKNVQIADLGKRLNVALAGKVEELQRYRSDFFGKLRSVLGNQPGIRIEGDRFVFQSELLFDSGSAQLGEGGQKQIAQLAQTLNSLRRQIPAEVNWILRVDGHTDRRPIRSAQFNSNWELSTARAITVVNTLINNGVPPERLAATGFGEFQPLESGVTEDALAKNRRIEIRFDAR